MTRVALPLRPATTANDPRPTQQRQMREWADEYDKLRQQLLAEEQELGGAESPLALLLNRIWEKARDVLGITPDAFMDWLEKTAPGDVSADAGAGATGARARIADAMDELDSVLLTDRKSTRLNSSH